MNIVLIHGQNHKGNTWNVSQILLENISCDKNVTEFFLPKDLNHFCLGCYSCLEKVEKCPFWNEKKIIDEKMRNADLIIFTTPNYCMMPSASFKAFLDLFFTNWMSHKPQEEMFKKKAVVISTAAGAGANKTCSLIKNNLMNWGIPQVYTFGISVNTLKWESLPSKKEIKIRKQMKKLGKELSKNKPVKVGIKTKLLFALFSGMQKANWGASPFEKQYWEEKGWLSGVKPWK